MENWEVDPGVFLEESFVSYSNVLKHLMSFENVTIVFFFLQKFCYTPESAFSVELSFNKIKQDK